MATPLPGPGLVGRGPGERHDDSRSVLRDRPDTTRPADPESTAPPAAVATETVDLLKADKAGDLTWWLAARVRTGSA